MQKSQFPASNYTPSQFVKPVPLSESKQVSVRQKHHLQVFWIRTQAYRPRGLQPGPRALQQHNEVVQEFAVQQQQKHQDCSKRQAATESCHLEVETTIPTTVHWHMHSRLRPWTHRVASCLF